jgi:hypothetical protein
MWTNSDISFRSVRLLIWKLVTCLKSVMFLRNFSCIAVASQKFQLLCSCLVSLVCPRPKAYSFSRMSVNIYHTPCQHIPQSSNLHENLKSPWSECAGEQTHSSQKIPAIRKYLLDSFCCFTSFRLSYVWWQPHTEHIRQLNLPWKGEWCSSSYSSSQDFCAQ